MSLDEIIEIMGGDFEYPAPGGSTAFGTGDPTGYIANSNTLPGFAFKPKVNPGSDYSEVKSLIKSGGQDYSELVVTGSAKYNDSISADMTYKDLAAQFGDFDIRGYGAERNYFYQKEINGQTVHFCFVVDPELNAYNENSVLSSKVLNEFNPSLHDIAVRH